MTRINVSYEKGGYGGGRKRAQLNFRNWEARKGKNSTEMEVNISVQLFDLFRRTHLF